MTTRRELILAAAGTALGVPALAATAAPILRKVPYSGEAVPVIGLGTSRTFDVDPASPAFQPLVGVMEEFFAGGGRLIDSSPMYGRAEGVTGALLGKTRRQGAAVVATKVWTDGRDAGIEQMNMSFARLGVTRMDLMQVHNLKDWRTHLPVLREWKAAGKIRYLGITTSFAPQYADFAAVMRAEQLDFVQLNYSIGEREAEKVLLPLARDRGIAVLVNRPFMRAELFRRVAGRTLPGWARDIGCESWGQAMLKWIVAHPVVTCVIPASAKAANMRDNMRAGFGELPDEALRARIAADVG
ncbi:MAG: aldo/keto reductase [Gammaproteobacteria bacterium]|nr:aldo/keto reductase [Gammaproteobacteria bacterium]